MEFDTSTDPTDFKVNELLKEVQLDYSPSFTKVVDDTVSAIKTAIDQIPEDFQVTADLAPGFVRDIGADKVEFKFKKPKSIEIRGSYVTRCIVKPDVNVDLFLRLPKDCFHEKDYLNHRYFAKRFLYLCIIKKYLQISSTVGKIEWSTLQSEARKPVLVVYPAAKPAENPEVYVRIIPTAATLFNISKLSLKRSNIHAPNQEIKIESTPRYNSSILEDMFIEDNEEVVNRSFLGWKELREALILLKIWARQRSSLYVHDCLNGFLISVILSYLVSHEKINKALKPIQIFRVALNFIGPGNTNVIGWVVPDGSTYVVMRMSITAKDLSTELKGKAEQLRCQIKVGELGARQPYTGHLQKFYTFTTGEGLWLVSVMFRFLAATSKMWKTGLYFGAQGEKGISKEERMQYVDIFPVTICHRSSHLNMAFRMSKNGFHELQDEAALTLKCMEKCKDGCFEEIFMTKVDYPSKFDYCIRLNLKGNESVYVSRFSLDNECWRLYEQKVQEVLQRGFNDRAKIVRVIWRNTLCESSIENGLSTLDKEPLFIGVLISSPEKAFRIVDIGPSAENKEEALKFRKFWGEKSELRRFKDSTIAESTVWQSEQWRRHLIVKNIAEYVLLRHLSISKDNIIYFVDQLDFSLLHGDKDPISFSGTLIQAFDILSNCLRAIQDIPLKVSSVQPLDPAFRFTSVAPPEPHPLVFGKDEVSRQIKPILSCVQAVEVMIQLEGSGNWPMDDIAVEKTKTAFLLKIGESLENTYGMICSATEDDVVIFSSGFAFHLKILHERGLSLLKREIGSDQMKRISSIDKMLFIKGQHASMINGLQGRYPLFGPVVRLAKRWLASHFFSACLVEEAVELLVAHLFLKPFPFSAPCSRITGFLRFLRLLSQYDWTFSPLVVDINNDLSPAEWKEISDNFMQSRKNQQENLELVEPAMFVATVYDKASEAWTKFSPNSMELKRLVAYARSSADLLTKLMLHDQIDTYRWECLFRTPLSNYDAVVLLHRDKLPYPQRLLFPSEINQGRHVACGNASKAFHPFLMQEDLKGSLDEIKSKVLVNFDPLNCLIKDIKREFSENFNIWYDCFGGDAIGLTWERSYLKKRVRQESEESEDPVDLLRNVGNIGKGLVRSVHLVKAPRFMNGTS